MMVCDLIDLLAEFPPEAEVLLAEQPRWAFEYHVRDAILIESRRGDRVYIVEGEPIGYLPGHVGEAIGW